MEALPLPPPFQGVNDQIPLASLQSPFCANLLNFNLTLGGATLRHGDSKYCRITGTNASLYSSSNIFPYGIDSVWTTVFNNSSGEVDIYNATTGALAYTMVGSSSLARRWSVTFNQRLMILPHSSTEAGAIYDGTTWGALGYTGTNINIYGGNVYKGRGYFLQYQEPAYWYSAPNQITGALTKVDLSGVVPESSDLVAITSFTLSEGIGSELIQTFYFSTGDVLFYRGSYPDSSDWALAGKAEIARPIVYNGAIEYQGDSLVLCDTGVVSLRELFLQGSQGAQSLSINSRIQRTWQSFIQGARDFYSMTGPFGPPEINVKGIWDPVTSRIIISFSFYVDTDGQFYYGSYYFIFDALLQAWYFHRSYGVEGPFENSASPLIDICAFAGKVLLLTRQSASDAVMIYEKEGADGFADWDILDTVYRGFVYDLESAPISTGKSFVQKAGGLDVILNSDLYDETSYQFIRDLGVESTVLQKIPSQPSGLQKPTVNMGIEGSYIQYKISGTTVTGKTVGYELYGNTVWVNQGGRPR